MKKKKMDPIPPEMKERFARTMRMLEERIAYHEKRAAEEAKRRGEAQP
jgi:hypothetical protein